MNKNKLHLNVSLLPIVLLVLLILGAGYFLMSGDINITKLLSRDPEVRRISGYPTVVDTNASVEKQRAIIESDQELAQFLNTVDPTGQLSFNDKVDFNKEVLLGVSTQSLATKRSTIKIKKLYVNKENRSLIVSIKQTDLGDKCEIEPTPNVSVDLVAISKTDWEINFEIARETQQCD